MRKLKVLSLGIALSLAAIMPGLAYDMEKDATEWSSNPDCMVTMYLGMPTSEYENNFSAIKGWKRNIINNYNALYPCHLSEFIREEPSKFSNRIIKQERLEAVLREDSNDLHMARIYFSYLKKDTSNYNYKKEILIGIEELRRSERTPTYRGGSFLFH